MEEIAKNITLCVSHAVEILSAVIIGLGVISVLVNYFFILTKHPAVISADAIRIKFGSSVAISLELLLGADVLDTAVAPSWDDIGKLVAIAIIRTGLNYFLGKELREIAAVNH